MTNNDKEKDAGSTSFEGFDSWHEAHARILVIWKNKLHLFLYVLLPDGLN